VRLSDSTLSLRHSSPFQIATIPPTLAFLKITCITRSGARSTTVLRTLQFSNCDSRSFPSCTSTDRKFSYQFNPDIYNPDVVINILLKALTSTAMPDFNLCVSLLDERPITAQLDEPDPLPAVLPILRGLHTLLHRCRFPQFWEVYRSPELEHLRDNYTVEVAGFENAVRSVAIRAVTATFTRISSERLGNYLDLSGMSFSRSPSFYPQICPGEALNEYVADLGWTIDSAAGVVSIPPNPDNQIEATVVQETVALPRKCP